jgi:glycine dehydrogenase subunit 2
VAARLPGFVYTHPYQPEDQVQGNLQLMWELQEMLKAISGFAGVSLQPAAGAHGELTGILIMRAYLHDQGETQRDTILIPDSAHGTNPASTAMAGFKVVEIKSDERGNVDLEHLKANLNDRVVGLMLTNPNTLGLFDEHVCEVSRLVHEAGGLMYGDGANMNAMLGIVKPADLGIDVMHFNLHKTFSTPHGGGGPGSGPVGVVEKLVPYLPGPIVDIQVVGEEEHAGHVHEDEEEMGAEGLRRVAENAVINANYLMAKVKKVYPLPYDRLCKHEFVVEGKLKDAPDIHALDISKRLIDYGVHPPTNYFPLIVPEALMIEPTETESLESLDYFADALLRIAEEAKTNPELLHEAPHNTPVSRLDEVGAARNPILRWKPAE